MKLVFWVLVIFWLVCGFAGDWLMDGLDDLHWKAIARGPLTLVEAMNENPVTIPTGN
jgi:hypothetical protein